jgi:GH24 family phage-related lysozyme (muramidase)
MGASALYLVPALRGYAAAHHTGGWWGPSVSASAFMAWTKPLEGWENFMYTDELGYVTTGMGNLINSIGAAQELPWTHGIGGPAASADEVAAAFYAVQAAHSSAYDAPTDAGLSDLRISNDVIATLVAQRLADNEAILTESFPRFSSLPRPIQLAIHGMAWAMGPAFPKPYSEGGKNFLSFAKAVNAGDWATAKAQSHFQYEAPQRTAATDALFDQALGGWFLRGAVLLVAAAAGGFAAYHYRSELGSLTHTALHRIAA